MDTFFHAKNVIGRNPSNLSIVDMPFSFNPFVEAKPSRKHGSLHKFFESFLKVVYHPDQTVKDAAVNSLEIMRLTQSFWTLDQM